MVNRETKNKQIIEYFTEPVIEKMRMRKITGAYIVSFVKQLKSLKSMKGEISRDDFDKYFELSYKGFYSSNDDNRNCAVGFNV